MPEVVRRAYPNENFDFGPKYIIPKPFDSRVLQYVAPAVAQAAVDSGVARLDLDIAEYEQRMIQKIGELSNS